MVFCLATQRRGGHRIAHFLRSHLACPRLMDVRGARAFRQHEAHGALHPIGFPGSDALACYGMNGERVKEYYAKGMSLNHDLMRALRPDYEDSVSRRLGVLSSGVGWEARGFLGQYQSVGGKQERKTRKAGEHRKRPRSWAPPWSRCSSFRWRRSRWGDVML